MVIKFDGNESEQHFVQLLNLLKNEKAKITYISGQQSAESSSSTTATASKSTSTSGLNYSKSFISELKQFLTEFSDYYYELSNHTNALQYFESLEAKQAQIELFKCLDFGSKQTQQPTKEHPLAKEILGTLIIFGRQGKDFPVFDSELLYLCC